MAKLKESCITVVQGFPQLMRGFELWRSKQGRAVYSWFLNGIWIKDSHGWFWAFWRSKQGTTVYSWLCTFVLRRGSEKQNTFKRWILRSQIDFFFCKEFWLKSLQGDCTRVFLLYNIGSWSLTFILRVLNRKLDKL